MKTALKEIMSQFYSVGVPTDVAPRATAFRELGRNATVIIGMRRVGKTYFTYQRMQQLMDEGIPLERIVHVNFDDERLAGITASDLHLVCDIHAELFPDAAAQMCWYFLDEVQNVKGWEPFARRLIDSHRVRLCLTGSSAKMLSKEVATSMRGRALTIELFPLSFSEYLLHNHLFKEVPRLVDAPAVKGKLKKHFAEYLRVGGFPDIRRADDATRISFLQEYANAVVYRDIIERHEIPSVQSLRYVMQYLLGNFARNVSIRAIAGVLKQLCFPCSREAIADYLSYFQDAYFAYGVSLRTDSLSVKRANPDKCYLVDTGLISALKAKNDAERGWILENAVFLALRRRFNKIEYYLTHDGKEVDFYVTDNIDKQVRLIQVSCEMMDPGTRKREMSALRTAREETGIADCTIVTEDEEGMTEDGIRIVPAWKWILETERA